MHVRKVIEDGSGEPNPTSPNSRQRKILTKTNSQKATTDAGKDPEEKRRSVLRTWTLRAIFTIILISYFCFTVYCGPILVIATTIAIQIKCFKEIINVAFTIYPMERLPWFRFISWYFLVASNYFFCGESLVKYFNVFIDCFGGFRVLVTCHRFISFCIYFIGVIWFVLHLGVKYDKEQFALLACTHVALIILAMQSYMIVKNIFQGMVWLIVPVTAVVCNDIMAYVCGCFFGKTPLIKLSPKKTWEGFIGGAVFTVIYSYFISLLLCKHQYLVCPIEYKVIDGRIRMLTNCEPNPSFQWSTLSFDFNLYPLKINGEMDYYPFMVHALSIALFSSLIAPFGGFFASGFKRAFKVKDFGTIIPGHGGIMDRFDCQFLVTTFVNVYISSFIKSHSVDTILQKVFYMRDEHQLQLFEMLRDILHKNNSTQIV